jgi:vacuolar-type H+-ATPase subunit C/Vma6
MLGTIDNLDYLAARLHGRRGRMAEGERLAAFCGLRSVQALAREVVPGTNVGSAAALQRTLVQRLAGEIGFLAPQLGRSAGALLHWMLGRFHVENLKLCLRALLTGAPLSAAQPYLIPLPSMWKPSVQSLWSVKSLNELVRILPGSLLRRSVEKGLSVQTDSPRPFFIEAALDQAYLSELLVRADRLPGEDRQLVRPLATQEADTFQLLLVARGRFLYGLESQSLVSFHVRGAAISPDRWRAMLAEASLRTAAEHAVGKAFDRLPSESGGKGDAAGQLDPAALEVVAQERLVRLANRAFRRSHMGVAAVVAYVTLRRAEVANLITLSEGLRASIAEGTLRQRLAPQTQPEVIHA